MNIENLDYLKKSLKYLGFGENLNAELERVIKEQPSEFKLMHGGDFKLTGDKREKVDFTIEFRKSDTTDMYFLNRYNATLRNNDPEKERTQTFYITKGYGTTAKEAYNLLSGRAVNKDLYNKENQPYNAWLQLNFDEKDKNSNYIVKQYSQGYGYDLESVLKKYPIKDLENEKFKTELKDSLEKGNLHPVTFVKEGREEKMFVEASPKYKNLNVYDASLEKKFQGIGKKEKNESEKSRDDSQSLKQDKDDDPTKDERKSKRRGVGV